METEVIRWLDIEPDLEGQDPGDLFHSLAGLALSKPPLLKVLDQYYNLDLGAEDARQLFKEIKELFDNWGLDRHSFHRREENLSKAETNELEALAESLKAKKATRRLCQECPLFGKTLVAVDAVPPKTGQVDLLFIGLNPGTHEAAEGKPFVGPAGKRLREQLNRFSTSTYAITNVILCHTRNAAEIENARDVMDRCREMVESVLEKFPARVIVPLGNEAKEFFGLKGSITAISGKPQGRIFPIIHPSAVRGEKMKELFENSFEALRRFTGSRSTLFDICNLGEKILFIFLDENGNKIYELRDNVVDVYVSKADDYLPLKPLTDLQKVSVKAWERNQLRRKHLVDNHREKGFS